MPSPSTVLLAGRMSAPRAAWLADRLTTDWNILTWAEDECFTEFVSQVPHADAIVAGRIRGEWPSIPRLKLYQIPFTGFDWISPADVPAGCTVCNTFEHEIAIAEYVLGAMLEWEIGLCDLDRRFRTRGWEGRKPGIGPNHGELYGKTVGIIGFGHIGQEVANRAKAFGMRTIGVARTPRPAPPPLDWLGTMERLDDLLAESDYVLVALPLSDETRELLDDDRLGRMKADAVVINVGRGLTISEEALYSALADRRIGGAILDVWYSYPSPDDPDRPPSRFAFQELDNVIMTPHTSGRTEPMRTRRWTFVAQNLDRLARGDPLQNICFSGTG